MATSMIDLAAEKLTHVVLTGRWRRCAARSAGDQASANKRPTLFTFETNTRGILARVPLFCPARVYDGAVLLELRVKNFVLIDQLDLHLEKGFNVLTGETGAGKSIVIGALGLVLGERAAPDLVRPGAEEAEVEALFDVAQSPRTRERLVEAGLDAGDEVVLRRVVQASGRSRAYLNGRLCTASQLSELASQLVDISSQHESVTL